MVIYKLFDYPTKQLTQKITKTVKSKKNFGILNKGSSINPQLGAPKKLHKRSRGVSGTPELGN